MLLTIGHGYSARALARLLPDWEVVGTTRSADKFDDHASVIWPGDDLAPLIRRASHVLVSVAPKDGADPVLEAYRDVFAQEAERLTWVGYFSTTAVYGDHGGEWIDEDTPLTPGTKRGQARAAAEAAWQSIPGLPIHILRLAGIYGPGRGPFAKVRAGTARRIVKPGQVFSRIHRDDIARVVKASIEQPNPGAIYNLCDDEPAPPQDVIGLAAELLGLPMPPEVDFENAEMSPMGRDFYAESKRCSNALIKELAGPMIYPTYREGLRALLGDA